ncbi:uncharacterized protein At4g18257 [Cannabis sativa]|uniref:Uncharacterized protein n=1 Tax=Cannabis sativa TaxID=3483 RepID=A0A7J6GTC4_CANSA|nr:uncharacterized protein At4g18257 [Cannabis sativa]KAF4360157.1 hypothetical protein F8388_000026 [Cannabis sativa]KAF4386031.1 hypothetical protein G4B88_031166 [Cannabis sativa]
MADQNPNKKRVIVESLGWLTESSIMPRKHRAIAGVGASSILDLKAQLYHSQEEAKKARDHSASDPHFQRPKKKIPSHHPLSAAKNSGVEARAFKDKLELKAVKDGSASYAALEKKAELYEKLMRGELSDEEEKEKYSVNFFAKRLDDDESQKIQQPQSSDTLAMENKDADNDDSLLFNMKPVGLGRAASTMDNNEHKRFVREVHQEANQAREKASELKSRREQQVNARREKLKQAYLRKQLDRKLKAASIQSSSDKT